MSLHLPTGKEIRFVLEIHHPCSQFGLLRGQQPLFVVQHLLLLLQLLLQQLHVLSCDWQVLLQGLSLPPVLSCRLLVLLHLDVQLLQLCAALFNLQRHQLEPLCLLLEHAPLLLQLPPDLVRFGPGHLLLLNLLLQDCTLLLQGFPQSGDCGLALQELGQIVTLPLGGSVPLLHQLGPLAGNCQALLLQLSEHILLLGDQGRPVLFQSGPLQMHILQQGLVLLLCQDPCVLRTHLSLLQS
mmetsp:Transcript_24535/g.44489  ORF Transcript_24535/g.44489 Transcript_24535/m.44489 type:complete len:240 (+) Transcript_24535:1368-2087(+)